MAQWHIGQSEPEINMAVSKVDIYKIPAKNLHISRIKTILRDVFLKYLQARY